MGSCIPVAKSLPGSFLPLDDKAKFQVTLRAPEGTSAEETLLYAERASVLLRRLPSVTHILITVAEDDQKTQKLRAALRRSRRPGASKAVAVRADGQGARARAPEHAQRSAHQHRRGAGLLRRLEHAGRSVHHFRARLRPARKGRGPHHRGAQEERQGRGRGHDQHPRPARSSRVDRSRSRRRSRGERRERRQHAADARRRHQGLDLPRARGRVRNPDSRRRAVPHRRELALA